MNKQYIVTVHNGSLMDIDSIWSTLELATVRRDTINEDPFKTGHPVEWQALIQERELDCVPEWLC